MQKRTLTIIVLVLSALAAAAIVMRAEGPCTPRKEHAAS
jgi:hypothetical protein